jgi:hypothetical protein
LFTSYSNAQELIPGQTYTTPNIVTPPTSGGASSWTGAVNQQSLTCWGGGDPGYCGPSPITLPNGNIHFSYGSSYIFQQQAVANVLPQITGLQVTGYNFGFTAKNGNGWDDGRVDTLSAVVRFWDTSGGRGANNILERREYNLNYRFNWTQFNYSENFNSALGANSIGQVQYGFIGRDNNGWAGPYGPEIHSVNFSLKYGVDPCQANPLSSPTCPGYLAALAKMLPAPLVLEPVVAIAEQPVQQLEVLQPVAQALSNPVVQAMQPAQQTQASQQTQQSTASAGSGLGFALNLISRNADRERAVVQQAVQQATQDAAASGDRAMQQAASVASSSSSSSLEASNSSQQAGSATQQNFILRPGIVQQTTAVSQDTGSVAVNQPVQVVQTQVQTTTGQTYVVAPQETTFNTSVGLSNTPVTTAPQETAPVQIFTVQPSALRTEDSVSPQLTGNFLTDPVNPLRSILEAQPQTQAEQPQQRARGPVQDSTLAGGVQLSSLGNLPQGYGSYLQLQLQDAKFYDIKPIYPNQRVVDNARVLRGLGSDALHQRLVDSQYK